MPPDQRLALLMLIALLLAKHFVCDFLLQTPYQLKSKGIYGHPGGLVHAFIHSVLTAGVLFVFALPFATVAAIAAAEFAVHYHIDWCKEQIAARWATGQGTGFWALLGFDQLLHQATYLVIAALV